MLKMIQSRFPAEPCLPSIHLQQGARNVNGAILDFNDQLNVTKLPLFMVCRKKKGSLPARLHPNS